MKPSPIKWALHILEELEQISPIEDLQRLIWPGCETDVVPAHLLKAAVQTGGLLIAAYAEAGEAGAQSTFPPHDPIGFVFGFPGFYLTPDGPRLMHYSHMLGIHPQFRNLGIGFALKRAQWQMVRRQGIDRISWTYDPLFSTNAHLNIARLGAVCNTYQPNFYGSMRDDLNSGLPSDRFQVDWWVNTRRVNRRLSKKPRLPIHLDQLLSAQIAVVNPASISEEALPYPAQKITLPENKPDTLLMVEIPPDFTKLKQSVPQLALDWRLHTREVFTALFERGYLVTDFVHHQGTPSHSFYVLSHGESTF